METIEVTRFHEQSHLSQPYPSVWLLKLSFLVILLFQFKVIFTKIFIKNKKVVPPLPPGPSPIWPVLGCVPEMLRNKPDVKIPTLDTNIVMNHSKMLNYYCKRSFLFLLALSFLNGQYTLRAVGAPTDGFTRVSLSSQNFQLHKPYDQPKQNRYSNNNGFETFWVYSNDKPFKQGSPTKPRTEMRISGHDYTSGVWQFEGNFYVPTGTDGACIMQVFGAADQATTLQLRVYDGNLKVYRSKVVVSNIYNKWFKLNVIHDVGNSRVTIFINDEQKFVTGGHGPSTFYFKYGVYAQDGSSYYMKSKWSGIKIFQRQYALDI